MRLVVAIIFVVAACGGTADRATQTADTPAPVSSARTMLQEFFIRVADGLREADSIVTDWRKEFDASDLDAAAAQALRLTQWADSETEWLDAHPSDPCYAETHASYSNLVTLYGQAAKLWREAVSGGGESKLGQANETMTQGAAAMDKMVDSYPISAAACAP